MIINDITQLIGNTPLYLIPESLHQLSGIKLYAKLEFLNPFGSVKDRIAFSMLKDKVKDLAINNNTIIENSSGNTAKALATIANTHGIPFKLVSSMVKVQETKDILNLLGVELEEIPGATGCHDPKDPNDPQYIIAQQVAKSNGKLFFTSQFTNQTNPETHYETTGAELLKDLNHVDYLCSGLGTSGSTLGMSRKLREVNPNLISVGITVDKNDFIPGIRTIEQIWESGFFDPQAYSKFVTINSSEAIDAMLQLIKKCGLLCGPSSGANFAGTLKYLRENRAELKTGSTVVFVACDRVEWYLSYIKERRPDLFKDQNLNRKNFLNVSADEISYAPELSVLTARDWIDQHNPLIIDIRNTYAFELGSLPKAINIPADYLEQLLMLKTPFTGFEQKVLFICPIGEQSKKYAVLLNKRGGNACSLAGGLKAWNMLIENSVNNSDLSSMI